MKSRANSKQEFNKLKKRVDIQVSLLTAAITLISSLSIFGLCYCITYSDAIQILQERTSAIYEKVDHDLNKNTFSLISKEKDINTISYEEARILLQSLRITTGAKYLFTIKENENGQLIYLVDGLSMTDEEFRSPGTLLEDELQRDAWIAIHGEKALPNKMYNTPWGKSYWTFYPVRHGEQVVGAVGIAFETFEQYHTYQVLAIITPIVCLVCCLIAVFISFHVFRRLSNPNYRDIYNTDLLTGLKNRNAFEVDISNINAGGSFENRAVLSIDLNNLKKVNDTLGHSIGDRYIQGAADILSEYAIQGSVAYRTGGDEFTVLITGTPREKLEQWIETLHRLMREYRIGDGEWNSFAIGYAVYDAALDKNLLDTYKRADQQMYYNKQKQKAAQKNAGSTDVEPIQELNHEVIN